MEIFNHQSLLPRRSNGAWRSALLGGALLSAALLWVTPSLATPADEADQLASQAMNDDFLATDFKGALAKLKQALKLCAACEQPVQARLYRDLGILYASGFNNQRAALANFQKAVKLDVAVPLPRAYASPEIRALFLQAGGRKETLLHDAANEQKLNTPVPIYAELLGEVPDAILTAHYRIQGQKVFRELPLDKRGTGFGGYLPCDAVLRKQSIEYYVTVMLGGGIVSSSGSEAAPFKVELVAEVDGEVRSLPGDSAPDTCAKPVIPDDDDDDDYEEPAEPKPEPKGARSSMYLSLGVQQDLPLIGGDDICTSDAQQAGPFYCFRTDGTQYRGAPVEGEYDRIDKGFALATTRVLLGFDLELGSSVSGFAKAGYVFGTGPAPETSPASLKFHGEVGLKYWFTASGVFPAEGLGVYAAGSGGVGQIDAKKTVPVIERTDVSTAQANPSGQKLDAWGKYGQGFASLGLGFFYPLGSGAVMLDVRGMLLFPSSAIALAPGLSYGFGL